MDEVETRDGPAVRPAAAEIRGSIEPVVEFFPMSKVNDALEHLRAGKARYRVVLVNDFAKSQSAAASRPEQESDAVLTTA